MTQELHNRKVLKEYRRSLRNALTPAEAALWEMIKNSQLEGRKFRRQHSVGNYILDFYCPSERLAIELDGIHHFNEAGYEHDEIRTNYLNGLNIQVIRFENKLIFEAPEGVLQIIKDNFRNK